MTAEYPANAMIIPRPRIGVSRNAVLRNLELNHVRQ
jgi:hypothetical protein